MPGQLLAPREEIILEMALCRSEAGSLPHVSATLKGGGDPVGRQQGNLRLDADYRVGV